MLAAGFSAILVAVGAILAAGLSASGDDAVVAAVGTVIMAVGGIGIVASLLFLTGFVPFGSHESTDTGHRV